MDAASPPPKQIRATGHTDAVLAVAAAVLDGREIVVTASADGTLRRWDATTGAPLGEPLTGHTGPVHAVALGTLSGRPVALSGGYDALRRWDSATGEQLGEALVDPDPAAATITRAARAQDGGLLAVTSPGHNAARPMRVWDAATGTPVGLFPYGTGKLGLVDRTVAVALGRVDGRTVAVSSADDGKVRIWDATTGRQLGKPLVERYSVRSLAVADLDGRTLALLGSDHRSARLFDLATREPLGEPLTGHTGPVHAVALGTLSGRPAAATGSWDGTVRLWNTLTARPLAPPLYFPGQVHAVALTPTGRLAVAAGPDLFLVRSPTAEPGP